MSGVACTAELKPVDQCVAGGKRAEGGLTDGPLTGAEVAWGTIERLDVRRGTVLAIVIGTIVRFIDIGWQSYSMDELWEFAIVRLPAGEIVGVGDGFPPLFHLMFRSLVAGGFGDMAGRVMSAALGVGAVWLTSRLGRRIGPSVGVAAALAVAVAPLLVLLSKEARAYALFILLAALLLLATWDVVDSGSGRSWVVFALVAAVGMYSHYMFALALASAELVILWSIRRDGAALKRWAITQAGLAVLLVPLVLIAIPDFELDAVNDYSRTVDVAAIGYAGISLFTGFTLGPSTRALHDMGSMTAITTGLPWILLIGLPAAYLLYLGWRGLTPSWRIRLGTPLVVPLSLLTILSAGVGVAFRVRYLAWLVIPLALWFSAGYFQGRGKLRHVAATVLLGVGVLAMITRVTVDDYSVEDARAAADFIETRPDTPAVGMAWYMTKPIEYYLGEDSATVLPADEGWGRFVYHEQLDNRIVPIPSIRPVDPTFSEQTDVFESAIDVGERYLFIHSRDFHADPDGEYFAIRMVADNLSPVAEFAGITIYEGVRGP